MPFKPGKSPKDLVRNVGVKLEYIENTVTERALTTLGTVIGGKADFYVPVDTNKLMTSRETPVVKTQTGWRLTIGYYGEYAYFLHGDKSYKPTWTPKPAGTPGKPTGGYNSSATLGWIYRGVAETDIQGVLKKAMKL